MAEAAGRAERFGFGKWILAGTVLLAAMIVLAWVGTRSVAGPAAEVHGYLEANRKKPGVIETASGLQVEVVQEGAGAAPKAGDAVLVHYEGRLADGTVFDSSVARGQPAVFGVGDLIPGMNEALTLMKPGGRYRIVIPPALAYGDKGAGGVIPPNAPLEFQIELLQVAAQP
jgi:FKBP-type peptidyl-prolyl cis-trans isomerase FkpA/FKBP-type peptidyl-prolyl cis-trans isomerase FklB